MKGAFATICILAAVITLLVGVPLLLSPRTGFLPDLGRQLGTIALGAGNAISLALNAAFLARYKGPRWLIVVTVLQLVPAAYFGILASRAMQADAARSERDARVAAVVGAARADDPQRYRKAWDACDSTCRVYTNPAEHLVEAVDAGASRMVALLIADEGPDIVDQRRVSDRYRTCDDELVLPSTPLGVAVARNSQAMVDLLVPHAGPAARRDGLWIAATLDRLAMLQKMAAAGLSLDVGGQILENDNDTLLVAAAQGASVRVGRWLIEEHRLPVERLAARDGHYRGTSPMDALMMYAGVRHDPQRVKAFFDMLRRHGADIDRPRFDGTTHLEEAIRIDDRAAAVWFVEAGASRARLNADGQAKLEALLAQPPRQRDARLSTRDDCIRRGD